MNIKERSRRYANHLLARCSANANAWQSHDGGSYTSRQILRSPISGTTGQGASGGAILELSHEAEAESPGFNTRRIRPGIYMSELLVGMRVISTLIIRPTVDRDWLGLGLKLVPLMPQSHRDHKTE